MTFLKNVNHVLQVSEFTKVSGPLMQIHIKWSKYASLSDVLSSKQIKLIKERPRSLQDVIGAINKAILNVTMIVNCFKEPSGAMYVNISCWFFLHYKILGSVRVPSSKTCFPHFFNFSLKHSTRHHMPP